MALPYARRGVCCVAGDRGQMFRGIVVRACWLGEQAGACAASAAKFPSAKAVLPVGAPSQTSGGHDGTTA